MVPLTGLLIWGEELMRSGFDMRKIDRQELLGLHTSIRITVQQQKKS